MQKVIALDTEFERYNTYRPILSLVQIKDDNQNITIYDVLDKQKQQHIEFLKSLLEDDSMVKIIHACRQDMEAIYCHFGITIKNIFDTQIAYKLLHKDPEIGYSKLVKYYCGAEIVKEKRIQKSHWLKRPITPEQMFYAKQDVEYLQEIYIKMMQELKQQPSLYKQFKNECLFYENEEVYKFNPDVVWQKYKNKIKWTDNFALIRELFFLREKIANATNLPREFVIRFDNLISFAESKNIKYLQVDKKVNKQVFIDCLQKHSF